MTRTAMIFYFSFFPINDLALLFSDDDDGSETLLIVMTRAAMGFLHFFAFFPSTILLCFLMMMMMMMMMAANIFGTPKTDTGFVSKSYDGFKVEVPSKWVPSSEREFPGQVLKYEDNFDAVTNFTVSITPSSKTSIKDYGPPEKFLEEVSNIEYCIQSLEFFSA
jgi:hypothetical protein